MRAFLSTLVMSAVLGLFLRPLFQGTAVQAGTALRMDVGGLIAGAELVIEGRILSAEAQETDSGLIETVYQVQVERTFLGDDVYMRSVRLPGGVLADGSGMLLAGMPRLRVGEDTMLFLSEGGERSLRVPIGLAQGRYSVVTRLDGSKLAVRDQGGLGLMDPVTGAVSSADGRHVRDYADFVAEIESAVAVKRAGGGL